ncbi:hypothetical protein DUI87_03440 [Hirundo rustica rustica]|uniref:Retroviral nucleocapsid Gag protein p24 C-terminal domain-containing protein n=1 Tax=Hirundo rustica rustica TaxID=333673 RepID=A0A3M0L7C7_HIRRU|nr:hypothetical protein DUI87_03440 [Hirundo rustica rustica]
MEDQHWSKEEKLCQKEPFVTFVERLTRAIELQVKKEGAQEQVLEEMALTNANEQCKAAILSLPMELAPTLDDMLQESNQLTHNQKLKQLMIHSQKLNQLIQNGKPNQLAQDRESNQLAHDQKPNQLLQDQKPDQLLQDQEPNQLLQEQEILLSPFP